MKQQQRDSTVQTPIHSGFGSQTTAREVLGNLNLKGKTVIVTGGYSGIGTETTRVLAGAGATIIVPARSLDKAKASLKGITNVEVDAVDLMEPASIDAFTRKFLERWTFSSMAPGLWPLRSGEICAATSPSFPLII